MSGQKKTSAAMTISVEVFPWLRKKAAAAVVQAMAVAHVPLPRSLKSKAAKTGALSCPQRGAKPPPVANERGRRGASLPRVQKSALRRAARVLHKAIAAVVRVVIRRAAALCTRRGRTTASSRMGAEANPVDGAAIFAKTENRAVVRLARLRRLAPARWRCRCVCHGVLGAEEGVPSSLPTFSSLRAVALGVFLLSSCLFPTLSWGSDIRADPQAPGQEQATILAAANGVPQVDIQRPSAAGVSRNRYERFDVSAKGAILNNSHRQVKTRLGGWINGNPHLAAAEARVIVNEVDSRAPSRLRGYTEIAGRRAELVIANPAGIEVDGAGFINSAGTTLSAGRARIEGGVLKGFAVREGKLTIAGGGLDDRDSDYTRLLARAFTLDAGIWAQDLHLTAGANDVAATGTITPRAVNGASRPALAIDSGRLGGMYAGAIELIATERGVGVNHGGEAVAGAGGLRIEVDGTLTNRGRLLSTDAAGTMTIRADSLVNDGKTRPAAANKAEQGTAGGAGVAAHLWRPRDAAAMAGLAAQAPPRRSADGETGVIAATGALRLATAGAVENHGTIEGARLDLEAKTLDNRGVLSQRGGQGLAIASQALDNRGGRIGLVAAPAVTAGAVSAAPGVTAASSAAPAAPRINPSASSAAAAAASTGAAAKRAFAALAAGRLAVTETVDNRGGTIANGGALTLRLAGKLDNRGGRIRGEKTLRAEITETLDNRDGDLAATDLTLRAAALDNRDGRVRGEKTLRAEITETLDNHDGDLAATDLTLRAAALDNRDGRIRGEKTLRAEITETLDNRDGDLHSAGSATLAARRFDDDGGRLSTGEDLTLTLGSDFTSGADIAAGGVFHLTSAGAVENRHRLRGGKALLIEARRLDNRAAGDIEGEQAVRVAVDETLDNRGLVNSNGETRLTAGEKLTNLGSGRIYGDRVRLGAARLENREETVAGQTTAAVIAARERLDLGAREVENQGGGALRVVAGKKTAARAATLLSLGEMRIGAALDGADGVIGRARRIDNRGGRIEAGGDLHLGATEIANLNRRFEVAEHVLSGEKKVARYSPDKEANWYIAGADGDGYWTSPHAVGKFVFYDGREAIKNNKWSEEYYTTSYYADRLGHSEAGQILVGGDLHVDAARLENENSQILVGGALRQTQKGLQFTNAETLGKTYAHDRGHGKHSERRRRWTGSHHREATNRWPIDRERITGESRFTDGLVPYIEHKGALRAATPPRLPAVSAAFPSAAPSIAPPPLAALPAAALLSDSALFHYNHATPGAPLIETDPAFANRRRWLSSAHQLEALGVERMMKRLGDGYYEQRLVNEQIARLTGYRRLDGYADDERQYRALLDNGVSAARELELVPGVALSASQVARLQHDIVWLVAESVTLPDGSKETVLVPRVTLRGEPTAAGGSLISATRIDIENATTLDNQGELRARDTLNLGGEHLANRGTIRGARVRLAGEDEITFTGGAALARESLRLIAKRVALKATTLRSGDAKNGQTILGRRARLTVDGARPGLLQIAAEQDITLAAAALENRSAGGATKVHAGEGDLELGGVETAFHEKVAALSDKNHRHHSVTAEIGSRVTSRGTIELGAGKNVTIRQGQIQSRDAGLSIAAGEKVRIEAGRRGEDYDLSSYGTEHGLFSKTSRLAHYRHHDDLAVGSELSAARLAVRSGKTLEVLGSTLVGDETLRLRAGKTLSLGGAGEHRVRGETRRTKKSGLLDLSPSSFTVGNRDTRLEQTETIDSERGSVIGSLHGDVSLQAGEHYRQRGGTVSAAEGDLTIAAQSVTIEAGEEQRHSEGQYNYRQSGVTVAVQAPFADILDPMARLIESPLGESEDKRIQALTLANNSFDLYRKGQAAAAAAQGKNASVRIAITYGEQKKHQDWQSDDERAIAAQLHAGKSLAITAAGAGEKSTLGVIGSDLAGEEKTRLVAEGALNLLGGEEAHSERHRSRSSGWNAGLAIDIGGNGYSLGATAGGNLGKGHGDGHGVSWRNSHIGGENAETILESGGTTTLGGAQVLGKQVTLVSGGDLAIISRQDEATYHARSRNVSAQVTVGYGVSASGSYEQTKIDSDYRSVGEQSAILAGDGGYHLDIGGKTELTGAAILSSGEAREKGKNRLRTTAIHTRDLENHATTRGDSLAAGGGFAVSGGALGQQQNGHLSDQGASGVHGDGLGYGHDSDRQHSVTRSLLDPAALVLSGGDNPPKTSPLGGLIPLDKNIASATLRAHSGALENRFDRGRMEKELGAQTQARRDFGRTLHGIDETIAAKLDTLQNQYEQGTLSAQDYERQRRQWHTLRGIGASVGAGLGAPSSSAGGILAAAASPLAAEKIGAAFKARAASHPDGQLGKGERGAQALAHGLLAAGVAAAGGNDAFSAGLAAAGAEASAPLLSQWLYSKDDPATLTKTEKTTLKTLAALGGAALGASGGESANTAAASQLAENAVAHNYLSHEEWQAWQRLGKARAACVADGQDCQPLQEKISALYRLDRDRDKTLATCQDSGSPACLREVAKVYDAFQSYGKKPQLSSAYVKVATQYGEAKQRYMGDIGKEALIDIVKDSLESPVAIADLAYRAYKGDEAAQSRLHAMGEEIVAFARSPVNHVSESMRERLALADKLDSQGRTRDADLVRTELYLSSGLTAIGGVNGLAKLPVALGKGVLKAGEKLKIAQKLPKAIDTSNIIFEGKKLSKVSAIDANLGFSKPPYDPSKPIMDFKADGSTQYVRVYNTGPNSSQGGQWMMKADDIRDLSPQQIKDKFDLPELPTHITDIKPPRGTKIRTGSVNPGNFGGAGGGKQFQLKSKIPDDAFTNPRALQ